LSNDNPYIDPAEKLAEAWGINPYVSAPSNLTPIPQPPQRGMARFTKANADRYVGYLQDFIGKWLVLYGGGGIGQNVVKLLKAEVIYYDHNEWVVKVTLKLSPKDKQYNEEPMQIRHLGSWRLATF
jgi:D-arabinose 1-dehydrogenase-like Zn-dependent alcohol dehydrogenase